jgi:hypothetical protein
MCLAFFHLLAQKHIDFDILDYCKLKFKFDE